MAVYIDNVQIKHLDRLWCHMVADTLDELHAFAKQLDIPRRGFHDTASYPHYDIPIDYRDRALLLGAISGSRRDIIRCAKQLKKEFDELRIKAISSPDFL